ncbi:hypothetical protein DUZ99_03105 [Xylanibacillus composti]|uniref:Uncharacterized protein n=1 Tax=Xylanibacillus composti TaxID=1572762 RepID=A0A8J4H375_9BACL|nr:hypothetical protein [Xylanibacillus composti]MDT9723987.1 hypothetical protein [Xylanibacillus composti]GIQ67868.1 hypothetical protein XYCOK13_06920 [Xylanibacillus composti]
MNPGAFEWLQQYRWHIQQVQERCERLCKQLEEQEERMRKHEEELETRLQHLEGKLELLKPVHIETINYKVQELHVRELSGTLVAGLSALADGEAVKKWLGEEGGGEVQLADLESATQPPTHEGSGA